MKNKKIIIILVCAILVVAVAIGVAVLWGDDISTVIAGEDIIECVMSNEYDEAKIEAKYVIHSNKKTNTVNKVVSTQTVETDDKTIIDAYTESFNERYKEANETYGGFDYNIESKDGKLTVDLTINYKKVDMDKFVEDSKNAEYKDFLDENNKIKTESLKNFYEKSGYGCNVKEK